MAVVRRKSRRSRSPKSRADVALICDTGPLLAALDAADPDHERCARMLTDAEEDLVVPTLVLAELDYWCGRRLPPAAWLIFLDDLLAGVYRVESPTGLDLARCRELQAQYADLSLGVVDASVVALAERLTEPKIATLDQRHFRAVRAAHVDALDLRP
jgi:predicted nucleic acid-binding protein